jgi:hypothetical protein
VTYSPAITKTRGIGQFSSVTHQSSIFLGLILVRIAHEPFSRTKSNRIEGERMAGFDQLP